MEVDECAQCEGICIDSYEGKQLQVIEDQNTVPLPGPCSGSRIYSMANLDNDGNSTSKMDYYYYKKEFIENCSTDDLFGFEF